MDRLDYAYANRDQYLSWCQAVQDGPWDELDKLEFAIISAHCPMRNAIAGWLATRGVAGVVDVAEALDAAGVMAPHNKAGYIASLRTGNYPLPQAPYREFRTKNKLPGLGLCKLSFGCCLIDPFGADVVCLDTHMIQAVLGRPVTKLEVGRVYRSDLRYRSLERPLLEEAKQVGLPPFGYQWAVWCWQRARTKHVPPLDHSFLWFGGSSQYQLPLET